MFAYAIRRLITAIPVLWIAISAAFFLLKLAPGGPFSGERKLPEAILKNLEAHFHLDKPVLEQYFIYMLNTLSGDLGPTFGKADFTVTELLMAGLPYTLTLGGYALIFAVVFGIIVGSISALYQNTKIDYFLVGFVLIGIVVPSFVKAPILQLVFGVHLGWFPVFGWGDGGFSNLALPVFVLSFPYMSRIARLMRASMIEVMRSNYIKVARAKGIGHALVLWRHALRMAMFPVVSFLGPAAGWILTGSIIVEQIFGLSGIGRYFYEGALNRDYTVVMGTVFFYFVLITVLNLIVDLLYAWLDPRVRYS